MNDVPGPGTILTAIIAIFVAVTVGTEMSSARNEVVIPLLSKCPPALLGDIGAIEWLTPFMKCSVGLIVFLSIPGALGLGLAVFNKR